MDSEMILKGHLGWGKCRLDGFVGMLLALAAPEAHQSDATGPWPLPARPTRNHATGGCSGFFREVVFDYDAIARSDHADCLIFMTRRII